jgi:UDP-N-acetylmuramoylalanine--D-glutamate ligase
MENWQGKRILILGAARQGLATLRYLLKNGASLIVNDQKPASEFEQLQLEFRNQSIQWEFGGHPISLLTNIDEVVISGGIPLTLPLIKEAVKRGIKLTNDSQIFMQSVKAKVIGITGSAGKTTTTTLVGEIAKCAVEPGQHVWVGGNIGYPLIDHLEEIKAADLVVTELSSFQLELMTLSPHIAAILNITPNHLDRHENMEAYIQAKSQILQYQSIEDSAILNCEDPTTMELIPLVCGHLFTFGRQTYHDNPGTSLDQDYLVFSEAANKVKIMHRCEVGLMGDHNLLNALAASAIGFAAGFPANAIRAGIQSVKSIPHRLEWIREWRGSNWYNDSIATAPERTMAAIRSFDQSILLMLGGRDKKLPWKDLANLIHLKVKKVVLFGEAADLISHAIGEPKSGQYPLMIIKCDKFDSAVGKAAEIVEKGDVVLLSPGCTSFDEFRDFEARGLRFSELVKALPQ